jgi:probable phosphoglycerate mutase
MQATRLILIRHGETHWNADSRIQGHTDIALNDTGRWQAKRVAQALADEPKAAVYASDLQRAADTALAIAQAHAEGALQVRHHIGLRERAFGHFEGLSFDEIETRWPDDAHAWRTRVPHWTPVGGESLLQVRDRVQGTLDAIASAHIGEQLVLVAHGGILDMVYRLASRQEIQAPRTWHLGNAAINRLLWTPQGLSLVGWGDVRHLEQDSLDEQTA